MWPFVVMLEQSDIILHNGKNMVLQNFITVPLSRQRTVDMDQFSPSCVRYRSPHHHTLSTSWMQFAAKRSFRLLYTLVLPSARCSRNLDSSLNKLFSIAAGVILCVSGPLESVLTVLLVQNNSFNRIPASRRRFLTVWS
jgi:hypothetical protein